MSYTRKYYQRRLKVLNHLGYDTYQAYLLSPLWSSIRASILERDAFKCRLCGAGATQVHHRSYSERILTGERLDDSLLSLCAECHIRLEFQKDGKKRDPKSTEILLSQKLKRTRKWTGNRVCIICELFQPKDGRVICSDCTPLAKPADEIGDVLWAKCRKMKLNPETASERVRTAHRRLQEIEAAVFTEIPELGRILYPSSGGVTF